MTRKQSPGTPHKLSNTQMAGLTRSLRPVIFGSAVLALIVFAFFRGDGPLVGAQTGSVFTNSAPITINESGAGSPNPSSINVTGLLGTVTDVNVTLNGFSHEFPDDVGMLLVSPSGRQLVIQSDVGGGTDAVTLTYTLDDQAAAGIPNDGPLPANNGSARPSSVGGNDDNFGPPAPAGPYNQPAPSGTATLNGIFGNDTPNGEWKLFVFDAYEGDLGSISGGWSIQITSVIGGPSPTPTLVPTPLPGNIFVNPAPITINESGPGSPNPSSMNVTGLSGTITDVNVTLNGFSHTYPDDVGILLVSPSGRQLVIQSDVGGETGVVNRTYTLDDQASAGIPDDGPLPANNGSAKPSSVGGDDDHFGPPAPAEPYNQPAPSGTATLNGIFSGDEPNGNWKLFVFDAFQGDAGSISGGWSIQIGVGGASTPTPTPTPTTTPTPTPTPTPSPTPNTPLGANVRVLAPAGDATIAFSAVLQAGTTTFTAFDPASAGVPPAGYTILNNAPAYDITTTAAVSPPIDVCFLVSAINDPTEFALVRILHEESGQFVDRTIMAPDTPAPDFGSRTVCARVGSLSRFVTARTAPTFSVSGRVTTPTGQGLRNAVVSLTDSLGVRVTATTSSFGVYSFNNVRSGEYLIGVSSKRYRFASQTVSVTGNLTNVNFVGLE